MVSLVSQKTESLTNILQHVKQLTQEIDEIDLSFLNKFEKKAPSKKEYKEEKKII